MMKDLWPKDIRTEPQEMAPLRILKQQAIYLGKKTRNIVQADVVEKPFTTKLYEKWAVEYHFELKAPAWGGYRYTLFQFFTNIPLYPVGIAAGKDIAEEILGSPYPEVIKVNSRKELEEILEKIFAARKTIEIIKALIIQSGAEMGDPLEEAGPRKKGVRKLKVDNRTETTPDYVQD
jgi:hypothetical protein